MLRFFSQLRKKLMEQNKVRTYLFYAVGEIALVVVGILLALQINNWNQQRIDDIREQNYLKLIKQELENNADFIQWFYLNRYDRKVNALKMIREYHQGTYQIQDSSYFALEAGYGAVFGTQTFQTSTAVFDEIISTGNLNIIKNEELRRRLIDYYGSIETRLEALKEYDSGYLLNINSLRPFDSNYPDSMSTLDMRLIIEEAGEEDLYRSATAELSYAHQAINFMTSIKEDAQEIIKIIETD